MTFELTNWIVDSASHGDVKIQNSGGLDRNY